MPELLTPTIEHLSPELRKERWFRAEQQQESQKEYIMMLKRARCVIKIRCGEMDPSFYENEGVINSISSFLKLKGTKVEVICGKDELELNGARETFKKENPKLWKLHKSYPKRLHLCWANKRPKSHFTVVDDNEAFVEAQHGMNELRATLFRRDSAFAKKLEERFDKQWKVLKCDQQTAL